MIVVYMMVVWFTVLLFSDKKYFICSIIILLCCISNILIVDVFKFTEHMTYVDEVGYLINSDGLTAFALASFYMKDKLSLRMSLLLVFSVACHSMIIYHLTIHSSFVSNLFYSCYDELIITIGLLQMAISSDGILSALRRIQARINRFSFYFWRHAKGISTQKAREGET